MRKLGILVLVVLALAVRGFWLGRFPGGVSHDDLVYVMSSKMLYLRGVDVSGVGFPQLLFGSNTEGVISPVPALLLVPYYGPMRLSLDLARWPFVILNLLTAVGVYVLVRIMKATKGWAMAAATAFAFNPWSLYLSRLTTDTAFALFFGVWGMAGLLWYRGRRLIWPGIFLGLVFFSYQGAKVLIIPMAVVVLGYRAWVAKTLPWRQFFCFVAAMGALMGAFLVGQKVVPMSVVASRGGEIIFLDKGALSSQVNDDRRLTLVNPFVQWEANKAVAAVSDTLRNYLSVWSGPVFFVSGDPTPLNNFSRQGLFYAVDVVFLGAGILAFWQSRRREFYLLTGLLVIAPLPAAIHTGSLSIINRGFLLLPVMEVFIGAGIILIYSGLARLGGKTVAGLILGLVMAISLGNFEYYYFFQNPVLSQETFFVSDRVVANILTRENYQQKVEVVLDSPPAVWLEAVFYAPGNDQNRILRQEGENFMNGIFRIGNTEFVSRCPVKFDPGVTYIVKNDCGKNLNPDAVITDRHYGGAIYKIYNDKLCRGVNLDVWFRFYYPADYEMEKMSNEDFCRRWINAPVVNGV